MSIRDVIKGYESEKEAILSKRKALDAREAVVDLLLKELKGATKKAGPGRPKKAGGRKKAARKGGRRRKGGVTVRDAILSAVSTAGGPLPAGEIIKGAVKLSGGAEASIRTQINALTKDGSLKQVPYAGRGFQYKIAGGKPAKKKPAAKKASDKKVEAPKS